MRVSSASDSIQSAGYTVKPKSIKIDEKLRVNAHLLAADATILLNPVERVVHKTALAAKIIRVAIHQLLHRAKRRMIEGRGMPNKSISRLVFKEIGY